jgi:hypothetical protein
MTKKQGDIPQASAGVHLGLASQLVQDLRDMRTGVILDEGPEVEARLSSFQRFVENASNAAIPVFRDRADATGRLTPTRIRRWTSLDSDQEPFALVQMYYGGDADPKQVKDWTDRAAEVVGQLRETDWVRLEEDDKSFLEKELEPFLERLERVDESPIVRRRRNTTPA